MVKRVRLKELAPREGFQSLKTVYPSDLKVAFIERLAQTGVSEIEVCSFVRPDRVPQMADAEAVAMQLKDTGTPYSGLYLNRAGLERAMQLPTLQTRGWIHLAASERFLKENANTTLGEAINGFSLWRDAFSNHNLPLQGLVLSTAFGSTFEGVIAVDTTVGVVERILEGLARAKVNTPAEIVIADTTGHGAPSQLRSLVSRIRSLAPTSELTAHLHDTRGTGMANVLAALDSGVFSFECSLGGLGGCPFEPGAAGNVATEDVAYLCEREGFTTGYNFDAAHETYRWFELQTGERLTGKFGRVSAAVV